MSIRRTDDFRRELEKLPSEIIRIFEKQKVLFAKNWLDPRLHTKRLKELAGVYSFRATRRYRVFFIFAIMRRYFSALVIGKTFTGEPMMYLF